MLLDFPFKTSEPISFSEPLRNYIQDHYDLNPSTFLKDLKTLDALRNDILEPDTHPSCLTKLLKHVSS